ncbi:uroporphyrinogen decarboxylase family protein [Thermodesulfobacteriota bacterium]
MTDITEKERFLRTMCGDGADRFPFFDLEPDDDTLRLWHKQGLSEEKSFQDIFGFEKHYSAGLTVRSYPYYKKPPDLLNDPSAFAECYDPDEPSRYVKNFAERGKYLNEKGRVVYVDAWGGGLLQMLGAGDWDSLVSACVALVEKPNVVENLIDRTTDFYCICLDRALSQVPIDYAAFYEPIASNTGPIVSPAMFERFAIPGYRKVLQLLDTYNVPLRILCTTGGDLSPLLPPLFDAGINGLWISNIRSAGMVYTELRRTYGPGLALIGGIDSSALCLDEAAIQQAVENTAPPLLEGGRYLPCLDDRPRSHISFSQYKLFRRILKNFAQL